MIAVLSLNTAVDRTYAVRDFAPGSVFRAERQWITAGGKGLNVARAVRALGHEVLVVGFLGGMPAPFIRRECDLLGIRQRWVETIGESRTCLIVADPDADTQTVLNEPGPTIAPEEVDLLRSAVLEALTPEDVLCISGTAPPDVPIDLYADLVRQLDARGVRALVDTSGEPLRLAWEQRPWAVTPNMDEAHQVFGSSAPPEEVALFLAERAEHVLLTLGAGGVMYAHGGLGRRYTPPSVRAVNAVASGDAFAAGFLAGITSGRSIDAAIRLGMACGASNASRLEAQVGDRDELDRLARAVTVGDV